MKVDQSSSDSEDISQIVDEQTPLLPSSNTAAPLPLTPDTFWSAGVILVKFGSPILLSNMITLTEGFITARILSGLGTETLSAMAFISMVQGLVVDVSSSSLAAIGLSVRKDHQNQHYSSAGDQLKKGFVIVAIMGTLAIALVVPIEQILLSLGQSEPVARITGEYFLGYVWCIPALFLSVAIRHFLYGTGRSLPPLLTNVLYGLITLSLGFVFSNGLAGEKVDGAFGMGLASTVGAWASFLALSLYTLANRDLKKYFRSSTERTAFLTSSSTWKGIWDLTQIGVLIAISPLVSYCFGLVITTIIGILSQDYLIPQGILGQYLTIATTVLFSICEPMTLTITGSVTTNQMRSVTQLYRAGTAMGIAVASLCLVLFLTIPQPLFYLFYRDEATVPTELIDLFKVIAALAGVSVLADSARITSLGGMWGTNDILASAKINVLSLALIGIPALLIAGLALNADTIGINITRTLAVVFNAVLMLMRWQNEHREITAEINQAVTHLSMSEKVINKIASTFGPTYQERKLAPNVDSEPNIPQPT